MLTQRSPPSAIIGSDWRKLSFSQVYCAPRDIRIRQGESMRATKYGLLLLLVFATSIRAQTNADWHASFPAFKIAGNLYYVGTADLAVYLIQTPQGNILINSDFKEDVPTIRKSIEQLGFKYSDTKILLISHAHRDHDEPTAVIHNTTAPNLMLI